MENQDGSEYISKASALINTIIQNQSTNVDTVSGATYSSVGIIQAVRNALSQAAVSTSGTTTSGEAGNAGNNGNQNQDTSAATGNFPYKEGIYYGTAEGYSGNVSVAVVIQEKSIKAILITETSDDEAFFQRAMGVVKNVLKTQRTEVDTVSGATYSSKGILGAIQNALKQAEKVTNGKPSRRRQIQRSWKRQSRQQKHWCKKNIQKPVGLYWRFVFRTQKKCSKQQDRLR